MRQLLLLLLLAIATYAYFTDSGSRDSGLAKPDSTRLSRRTITPQELIIVPAPSSYDRWKTGPTAQNDWKTGPNAQTNFEPFAPSEQASWNQTSGYTIVSGAKIRR